MSWQGVQFAAPYLGLLVLLWPLFVWLHRYYYRPDELETLKKGAVGHFRHPLVPVFAGTKNRISKKRGRPPLWQPFLRGLILLVAMVALMQPGREKVIQQYETVHSRHQLMFVLESSVTMILKDYALNGVPQARMTVVKAALSQLMQKLDKGRYGLVLYGETAGTLLPLTFDKQLFIHTLDRIQPYLLGRTDEGVGAGLGLALRTKALEAVVLISDGMNQPSRISLTDVVALAQQRKVPVYTIGVGAGSHLQQSKTAGLLFQPLDAAPLKALAQQTGGQFFSIEDVQGLQTALQAIMQQTGSRWTETRVEKQWQGYSAWLIAVLLGLLTVYGLLGWWEARRVPL